MVFRYDGTETPGSSSYGSIPEIIVSGSDETSAQHHQQQHPANSWKQIAPANAAKRVFSGISNGRPSALAYSIAVLLVGSVLFSQIDRSGKALSNQLPASAVASLDEGKNDNNSYYYDYPSTFLLNEAYDATALYYDDQKIDHLDESDRQTYSQRYYKRSKHFGGPGHPILMIMGGEAALELPMLYPFVNEGLASTFGAFVVSPEHRFYGKSQPVGDGYPSVPEMMAYLSPDQALEDAVQLVQFVRNELGCHSDKTHPDYCPVITFGGSYPGFLSGMLRFVYPDIVDASYASSAPFELYSQEVEGSAYFDKVTAVADEVSEGCSDAVRSTLYAVRQELYFRFGDADGDETNGVVLEAAKAVGFCPSTFPSYIEDIDEFVSETIQYLVPAIFADFNMGYYPPGPEKPLARACTIFQEEGVSPMNKIRGFFDLRNEDQYKSNSDGGDDVCFDVSLEIPAGPNARIRGSDSSGMGGGLPGRIWEFQCCNDLIVKAGYSEESMFLPRPFSYEWHRDNCMRRFPGIHIEPFRMNDKWGFTDLSATSRILFANGMKDGWAAASITNGTEVSEAEGYDELSVLNFPNGAHHSELRAGLYPNPNDTQDILEGYQTATKILSGWLDEMAAAKQ